MSLPHITVVVYLIYSWGTTHFRPWPLFYKAFGVPKMFLFYSFIQDERIKVWRCWGNCPFCKLTYNELAYSPNCTLTSCPSTSCLLAILPDLHGHHSVPLPEKNILCKFQPTQIIFRANFIGCTRAYLMHWFPDFVFHCISARRVQLPSPVLFTTCTPRVLPTTALANFSVFGVRGKMATNSRRIRTAAQCMIACQYNSSSEDNELL